MKINEIKQPKQLDEVSSLAGALFGEVPMASLKGLFTGKGGKHQLAQDIFLRDFYQDALTSLDNGIKSGFVNTQLSAEPKPNASSTPPKSSAAIPTTSPTQVPPAQQTGQTMSPQQTATAKMQTRAGIQPTGQQMTAAQKTQAKLQARKMNAAQKPKPVKESKYENLNSLFENIIAEQENPNQDNSISVSEYMLDWFGKYMEGVAWETRKDKVMPYIQQVEKTYASDSGRAAIKNLAKVAFALSKMYGAPAGAKNAVQNVSATPQSKARSPEQVAADLVALKPRDREAVIQQAKKAT
jgi:hypothetical protein